MSNPPAYGDPDRIGSANYYCGASDNGGVHTNSGVANKAAYLMVDGGTFNDYTIAGIGLEKTAKIWYLAQTSLLTSAADYQDLGLALNQACNSLIGTAGITSSDCQQMREAVAAVEMHLPPACPAPNAPFCDSYGFDSQFNRSAPAWASYAGAWYIGASYLYTPGMDDNFASAAHYDTFSDFDYEVKMRRLGSDLNSNGVIVRGDPFPFWGQKIWSQGYAFYYAANGQLVILHLYARSHREKLEDAIAASLYKVMGAFSLLFLTRDALVAARDPWGFRPLVLGTLDGATIVASETCALDLIDARYVRDVEPGEVLVVDASGLRSFKPFPPEPTAHCVFEHVYFARPDSLVFGRTVLESRLRLGRELARESPAEADMVCPIPDSGMGAALGFAEGSGLPFEWGLIRNH